MKLMFLFLYFFSQVAFAKAQISVGQLTPESFTSTIQSEDPTKLTIRNSRTKTEQTLKFKTTISDTKKLVLSTLNKKNQVVQLEMLLVVLAVYDKEQSVKIFIPEKNEEIQIQGQLNPTCSLRNEGDFSWDTDQELMERIQLIQQGSKQKLQIKIGQYKEGKVQFSWVDCFSF
jgi:hypothetical protein